jgi:hypothetical protein
MVELAEKRACMCVCRTINYMEMMGKRGGARRRRGEAVSSGTAMKEGR